jgi:hypothetical protein
MTTDTKKKLQDAVRELRETYYRLVAEDIRAYPDRSYTEIGRAYGIGEGTVYQIARLNGLSRNNTTADGMGNDQQGGNDAEL